MIDRVALFRNRFQPAAMLLSLPARRPRVTVDHPLVRAAATPVVALNSTGPGPGLQPLPRATETLCSCCIQSSEWLFQLLEEEMAPTSQSWTARAVQL